MTLLGGIFFTSDEVKRNQDALFFLFLVILSYNLVFIIYWILTFIISMVRYYAKIFNKIQGYFNKRIKIDDYETNLRKYLGIYVEGEEANYLLTT